MNLAALSLVALAIAVTLSCTTKINVGILSMALAWIIGVYLAGRPFNEVLAGFPTGLFLTLVGVTLLFTQGKVNGTLDKIAHRAVRSCGGSLPLVPIMFFFLAFVFGSIGPRQRRVGSAHRPDGDDRGSTDWRVGGMAALAGAVILVLAKATDESQAIRSMPWGPILMVSGVTVLISLIEKTGGIDLFSSILASLSSRRTVTGITAFIAGSISIYSSTAGVVLPAFLPTVPGLVERLGGGDVLPVAWSMIVGAHLVDVSPLSTTGALCISAAQNTDVPKLFRQMLAWGMSMAVVAAIGCYIAFGLLWG